jgi:hypothetical protein
MQLLIPFAVPVSEAGRQAAAALALPRLQALLNRLDETWRDTADETSLSPPHERALARALGLAGGSGLLPWAAHQAAADGVDVADLAWGLATPCHWHLGTEQVSLMDPAQLLLGRDHLAGAVPGRAAACSPATATCCAGVRHCAGTWRTKAWPAWPLPRWTA